MPANIDISCQSVLKNTRRIQQRLLPVYGVFQKQNGTHVRSDCNFSIILNSRSKTCNKFSMTSLLIKKFKQIFTVAADHVSDRRPVQRRRVALLQTKKLSQRV